MLTEFGGIAFSQRRTGTWGYSRVRHRRRASPSATRSCCAVVRIARAARRLLLHAVRRHLPGGQRPAATPTARRSSRSTMSPRRAARRRGDADRRARGRQPTASPAPRLPSTERDGAVMYKRVLDQAGRPRAASSTRARADRAELDGAEPAPAARGRSAHLRWHPLRGEWVAYASASPASDLPAAARVQPARADERPGAPDRGAGRALGRRGLREPVPDVRPRLAARSAASAIVPTAPGRGVCEVVVFTQDPRRRSARCRSGTSSCSSTSGPTATDELGARARRRSTCIPFENRGVEVGVTLHHPHGQIYAYPFVPPVPARELGSSSAYFDAARPRRCSRTWSRAEIADGRRMLYAGRRRRAPSCRSARATRTRSGSRRAAPAPSLAALDARRARATSRAR